MIKKEVDVKCDGDVFPFAAREFFAQGEEERECEPIEVIKLES